MDFECVGERMLGETFVYRRVGKKDGSLDIKEMKMF